MCWTEHLDNARRNVEGYKSIADSKAGQLLLYHKLIEQKHRRRPSSDMVTFSCSGPFGTPLESRPL